MAVRMRKWSPWTPAAAAATRKFQVAVKPIKLELGFPEEDGGDDDRVSAPKFVAVKIKWRGEGKFFPLMAPKPKKEISSPKVLQKGSGIVQWDDDDRSFENTCCFSIFDSKFVPWEISFNVVCGEKMNSRAKTVVIGRLSMNLSEIASEMENSSVEKKLNLNLQIDGIKRDAMLTVLFNFVEIREADDLAAATRLSTNENMKTVKARRRSLSLEEVSLDGSDEAGAKDSRSPRAMPDSDKKERWFSWTSRHFSFKRAKTKEENSDEKTESCNNHSNVDADTQPTASSSTDSFSNRALQTVDGAKSCLDPEYQDDTEGVWEEKELISRDGQTKHKASVFFASFDQCSDKAAGESACTALVAVISHWLHTNIDAMPNRLEFDNLIIQGSSEWRKLCEDESYVNEFPNKHFDLETVLRADIRPVSISHNKSFVGFFGADAFEALKGAMSFDDIWNEISRNFGVYIVSWNDHFFVLKAEENGYYIIDTLGERLYEGCNQAYVLRFDDNSVMQKVEEREKDTQTRTEASETGNGEEGEEVICRGKECCREFIKRFFAAIPLKELEEEERKNAVSYFSLHQRLQIEFNYSVFTSPVSSLTSSPLSSLTAASSPFSE